ncbi:transmembrane protein 255B [Thunnus albacares]|uniref:transmembrane protein 255B n=1 Tax=Thunnus maccoyii TaxID=8240 RepID=UPI001C4B6546|nr:transmembrane protein 255B [Thunnus maccoyii]XP_042270476.1 transmembrane protein 255B [Thunnus maccoyii]XP_044209077.1 transmembrane protein 255B [Thunnus albacares]XP_044209078.1 transmembrane protein 255B [Thunnus albacares]
MTARIQGVAGQDKPVPKSRATETMMRVRRALWLVLGMLSLSLLLVVLGVYISTRTESLTVSGYTSGVILTLGSFLGLLGLRLEENRKQLLTAAIVFLSFGIISSFLCLVIDGVCIVLNLDMRPLKAGRCQYYSSGSSYIYENFYTSVSCWNVKESCSMTVRSGTCYCCDLYDCANGGYLSNYYEFVGVRSCEEVFTLYILIWTLTGLNLVAFFTGILTTAVLGSIKDLRSSSQASKPSESAASSPTAPLLMDANTHRAHQLHTGASVYFPPAEGTVASQSFPSSSTPHTESNPPPFAPPSSLLPYRIHSISA